MIKQITFQDIEIAHKRISNYIHNTPILTSTAVNDIAGAKLLFKCENFQKVGAFKFRGATNAILCLSKSQRAKGVCTHSSGNHAQALSLAAKSIGIPAYIVMPETAPKIKVAAVKSYGAKIFFCKPTLSAREEKLAEVQAQTGAEFIHPYDNANVIAGQGTAAKELLESNPEIDIIIAPVGGGGLMSGSCISSKGINSKIKIIGSEPLKANDAYKSIKTGIYTPSINPDTCADGLLTSLSDRTFKILKNNLDDIITCSEEAIFQAIRLFFERMKIVVEPSGAVPLACILEHPELFKDKNVGIIISGGNMDSQTLNNALNK